MRKRPTVHAVRKGYERQKRVGVNHAPARTVLRPCFRDEATLCSTLAEEPRIDPDEPVTCKNCLKVIESLNQNHQAK